MKKIALRHEVIDRYIRAIEDDHDSGKDVFVGFSGIQNKGLNLRILKGADGAVTSVTWLARYDEYEGQKRCQRKKPLGNYLLKKRMRTRRTDHMQPEAAQLANRNIREKLNTGEYRKTAEEVFAARAAQAKIDGRPTFRELAETSFKMPHPKNGRARSAVTIENYGGTLQRHVFDHYDVVSGKLLGDKFFDEVTRDDILGVTRAIAEAGKGSTARLIKQSVGVVFAYAQAYHGLEINPAHGLPNFEGKRPQKFPPKDDQLHTIWMTTNDSRFQMADDTRLLIRLAMLTAARRSLVAGARHDELHDLDGDAAEWVLPAGHEVSTADGRRSVSRTKNREVQIIPLAPRAAELFRRVRDASKSDEYLFPARNGAKRYPHLDPASPSKTLRRAAKKIAQGGNDPIFDASIFSNIEKCTLHTMRHAVSTFLENAGAPSYVADLVLHHLDQSTRARVYSSATRKVELRHAYALWERRLSDIVDEKPFNPELRWNPNGTDLAAAMNTDELLAQLLSRPDAAKKLKAALES